MNCMKSEVFHRTKTLLPKLSKYNFCFVGNDAPDIIES